MFINLLKKIPIVNSHIYNVSRKRAIGLSDRFLEFLTPQSRILDIGAGSCGITELLKEKGHDITPLDIHNVSFVKTIDPVLYDGNKIPYEDKSFDYSLIILVLHHTKDPLRIIKEAKRVSNRIVVMEEIYETKIQKFITHLWDDLINLELFRNPHQNKSVQEWEAAFEKLNLKLVGKSYGRGELLPLTKQVTFLLET